MKMMRWIALGVLLGGSVGALLHFLVFEPAQEPPVQANSTPSQFPPQAAPRSEAPTPTIRKKILNPPLTSRARIVSLTESSIEDELFVEALEQLGSGKIPEALFQPGLLRRTVAIIDDIAEGLSPTRHLRSLALDKPFPVLGLEDRVLLDPSGHARFDPIVKTFESIDVNSAADLYEDFSEAFEIAYEELGDPERSFREALEAAILDLLEVPEIEGEIELILVDARWEYFDPDLEARSPAQKQLIRMGPKNTRIIQDKLLGLTRALELEISETTKPTKTTP